MDKILSPKVLIIFQFILLSIGFYLLRNFWPILPLDSITDSLQAGTIRLLFTFTFSGPNSSRFWILVLLIATTLLNVILLIRFQIQKLMEYFRIFYMILVICHYFAWIFVDKYSPIFANQISSLFLEDFILRGIALLGILFISVGIRAVLNSRKNIQEKTSFTKIPTIEFICPHCQAKYASNVKYCVQCHQIL